MKPLILEDGLFDDIEASIADTGSQISQVIRAILEQDEAKFKKAVAWFTAARMIWLINLVGTLYKKCFIMANQ